tara:strand:- start:487 stop:1107 length:621 start_codon:yes stop_codon:yes gene_type:complete
MSSLYDYILKETKSGNKGTPSPKPKPKPKPQPQPKPKPKANTKSPKKFTASTESALVGRKYDEVAKKYKLASEQNPAKLMREFNIDYTYNGKSFGDLLSHVFIDGFATHQDIKQVIDNATVVESNTGQQGILFDVNTFAFGYSPSNVAFWIKDTIKAKHQINKIKNQKVFLDRYLRIEAIPGQTQLIIYFAPRAKNWGMSKPIRFS